MKVEKQGESECLLATMAALRGVPLESVRKRAINIACTDSWQTLFKNRSENRVVNQVFWGAIKILAKEMNIPYDILVNKGASGGTVPTPELPEGKKGAVSFMFKHQDTQILYHICPFENGMVYDPDISIDALRETGMTLNAYIEFEEKRYNGKVKVSVTNIGVIED